MDTPGIVRNPQNLTGQVSIIDIIPTFTGNYSSVYLGALNGSFVAIKVVKATGHDDAVTRKLFREIVLWASMNHQNIHPFYGFASDEWWGPLGALISPWCVNGDATRYLAENGNSLIMAERVSLWRGVIEGVAYLHEHQPTIVHGDLKPGNVLIDDLGNPRICDFGLARVFLEVEGTGMTTTSEHTGTPRYLAPELVMSEENVYPTTASDVYALGCLGLESKQFLYGRKPYENCANNLRGQIINDLKHGVPPSTIPPCQHWSIIRIWPLITQIWSLNPHHRPPASSLAHLVKPALRSIPLNIMQCVANFVDIPTCDKGSYFSLKAWCERTRHVRTLCLVSKAFWVLAMPLLYGYIVIDEGTNSTPLTRLIYTLNASSGNPPAFGTTSRGYGTHTKYFFLYILDPNRDPSSDELRDALCMMSNLQTAEIWDISRHPESKISPDIRRYKISGFRAFKLYRGRALSHILEQRWISHAMPFVQSLSLYGDDAPREQSGSLFIPDLLEIRICGERCSQVTNWVIPNLIYLDIKLFNGYEQLDLISLLQQKGRQLLSLALEFNLPATPDISEIFSLCPTLITFKAVFYADFSLSLLASHLKLARIHIEAAMDDGTPTWETTHRFVEQVDRFISAWRLKFPSLSVASLRESYLTAKFDTKDNFYTITDNKDYCKIGYNAVTAYKRWEGAWIERVPPPSFYQDWEEEDESGGDYSWDMEY